MLPSPDCEAVVEGALAQPTNALSSLAFLAAAGWIAWRARRSPLHRTELLVFAVAVGANAVGGVLYHGERTDLARAVHDAAIAAVLLFIATFGLARFRDCRWSLAQYAAGVVAIAVLLVMLPAAAYAVFAVLGIAIGWWELGERRRELQKLRRRPLTARRLARAAVLLALVLAATAFFVGRSGAPLCRPESAMQWHAVWHVLSALAMALYTSSAIEPYPDASPHPSGGSPRRETSRGG